MPLGFSYAGVKVLLFSGEGTLTAWDLDRNEVLWEVFTGQRVSSTPAVSVKYGKIYALTRPKNLNHNFEFFQIDLDGTNPQVIEVDLSPIFEKRKLAERELWHDRIGCKTAIALVEDSHSIYFSCSIATSPAPNKRYGKPQGLTGLVLKFDTDDRGNILSGKWSEKFETSKFHPGKKYLGYDTGVYNLGSKPAVLKDGSLIVATGNGPVDLGMKNFGCSIVRLTENLEPLNAFTRFDDPSGECWYFNTEYASSAVGLARANKRVIGAVLSKDGVVTIFDPYKMNSKKNAVKELKLGGSPSYGQPASWETEDKVRFYFFLFRYLHGTPRYDEFLLAQNDLPEYPKSQIRECFGFIQASSPGSRSVKLYYSGSQRDDYVVAIGNTAIDKKITTRFAKPDTKERPNSFSYMIPTLVPSFRLVKILGKLISRKEQKKFSNLDDLVFEPWPADLILADSVKHDGTRSISQGYLKPKNPASKCPTLKDLSLTPLYQVRNVMPVHKLPRVDSVVAVDVDDQLNVKLAWQYSLKPEDILHRTHPVISTDENHRNPVLVFSKENPKGSSIILLDGATGKELYRKAFQGTAHYSMPLVFDRFIAIATKNHGVKLFELQN